MGRRGAILKSGRALPLAPVCLQNLAYNIRRLVTLERMATA
jgi:hypothetical protein